jgi:hypothetical protein
MSEIYLRYVGQASLAGAPARDLTREEALSFGEKKLLDSGLYVRAEAVRSSPQKQSRGASFNKVAHGGSENKSEQGD